MTTLPRLGLGGSGLHPGWAPLRGIETLFASLDAVLAQGAALVELAPNYGRGESERTVGRWLRSRGARDRVILVGKVPPAGVADSAGSVRRTIESSLKRTCTDYFDVVLVHSWRESAVALDATLAELRKLEQRGTIRAVGISALDSDPGALVPLVLSDDLDCVSLSYNVFDRSRAERLLAACAVCRVPVIGRAAFMHGALVGLLRSRAPLPPTDDRAVAFSPKIREVVSTRVAEFEAVADSLRLAPHELALRFAASEERINTLLVGMRTVEHVALNRAAVERGPLSAAIIAQLWDLDWPERFGPIG